MDTAGEPHVSVEELIARRRDTPRIDAAALREDIDQVLDPAL
ncbi:hypothetical protein [Ornithinimicrobium faecis]|nr:hypothetical protein [Ornithinimicrobium sp. HY1793]